VRIGKPCTLHQLAPYRVQPDEYRMSKRNQLCKILPKLPVNKTKYHVFNHLRNQINSNWFCLLIVTCKGLSIKDVRSQEGWGFPVQTICGRGRSADAGVRTFWCKNLRIFWNLWFVGTDKPFEPVRTFCRQKGKRVNFFANLYGCFFYGRPL